jgi:transposase
MVQVGINPGTLKVRSNIEFYFLPPYSPKLNPVEQFWKYVKDNTIKNQMFDTLKDIEDAITLFLRGGTFRNEVHNLQ